MHTLHPTRLSRPTRFVLIFAVVVAAVVSCGELRQSSLEAKGHAGLRLEDPSRAKSSTTGEVTPALETVGEVIANVVITNEPAVHVSPSAAETGAEARAEVVKHIPINALTPAYTHSMVESDLQLATIFGGSGALAAANGFEPEGLASQYPRYRGDLIPENGKTLRGHLSYALHLYGSADGTGDTELYVPSGFTSHSSTPTPTDAAVTFYYPQLGNLTDVTLAVFHVANFQLSVEGGRVRIGKIGGKGGSIACYRHSHLEFYRGDTGLPPAAARSGLRIEPTTVFATVSAIASRTTTSFPHAYPIKLALAEK